MVVSPSPSPGIGKLAGVRKGTNSYGGNGGKSLAGAHATGGEAQPTVGARASSRLATIVVGVASIAGPVAARADTPTLGNGDCWRANVPWWCTYNWQGMGSTPYWKIIDDFSWAAPWWWDGINDAKNAWFSSPGPQWPSWDDNPNMIFAYMEYSDNNGPGLSSGVAGTTFHCTGAYCSNQNEAIQNVRWSTVWLNHDTLDSMSGADFTSTVAHEMGHVFGLGHHQFDGRPSLMYPFSVPDSPNPQGDDIGSADLCGGSPPGGVRCVFGTVGAT